MINNFVTLYPSVSMDCGIQILQGAIAFVLLLVFRDFVDFFPFTLLFGIIDWLSFEFTAWWVTIFYRRGTEANDYGIQESYYQPTYNTEIVRSTDPDYHEKIKKCERKGQMERSGTGSFKGFNTECSTSMVAGTQMASSCGFYSSPNSMKSSDSAQ